MLEKEPIAVVPESAAFDSESAARKALTATYHTLLRYQGYCCASIYDIIADNARKGGEGASDWGFLRDYSHFNINAENRIPNNIWERAYLGINRANRVIKNIPDIEMDQNEKTHMIAEAKFLRAFHYFRLVKAFGDVPLIITSEVKANEIERDPKDQVYELIVNDFTEASEILPLKSQLSVDDMGRATRGAAQAYLGYVFLFQRNFQKAETWFKKVIDSNEYHLNPDYEQIFDMAGEFGPGHIFEINYIYDPEYPLLANRGTIRRGSAGMYGWGFDNPTQDLVDAFEPNDPRLPLTVFKNGDVMPDGKIGDVGNSETIYSSEKPYMSENEAPPTGDPRDSGKNEILLRYGQILLWYAEAANENGNIQEALDALNKVRERARQGNPNILPDVTATNQDQLREKIWHEERTEYAMENKRFFDLLRQERAGKVLRNFAKKYNTPKGRNFQDGVHELLPIPQSEIDLSQGKLEQNPGYD